MPTIVSHAFVSVALGPTFRRLGVPLSAIAVGAVCCIVPDIDVVGFALGIPYGAMFGHRGFTHSFVFAALLAAALVPVIRGWSPGPCRPWPVFWLLFLCTASHPLLDAFTSGGHGVALLSPFSNERYFFPWRPIRVSPIGVSRFLSGQANHVLLSELKWVVLPCVLACVASWRVRWRPA